MSPVGHHDLPGADAPRLELKKKDFRSFLFKAVMTELHNSSVPPRVTNLAPELHQLEHIGLIDGTAFDVCGVAAGPPA